METPKQKIANRIKHLRIEKGLTQEELGGLVNLSGKLVSDTERGVRSAAAEEIALFASALGVSADWLLGLSDILNPDKDFRSACKTFGLSDKAGVNMINHRSEYLSWFLEKEKVLSAINKYLEAMNNCILHDMETNTFVEPGWHYETLSDGRVILNVTDSIEFFLQRIGDEIALAFDDYIIWRARNGKS